MQISPEIMHAQVGTIYEHSKTSATTSTFVEGAKDCSKYMEDLFSDWQAKNITSVLHEKKGGYANNYGAIYGLGVQGRRRRRTDHDRRRGHWLRIRQQFAAP